VEAPAGDLLTLNTPIGTKTAFLTPEKYDEHPHPFYIGVPPSPPPLSPPNQGTVWGATLGVRHSTTVRILIDPCQLAANQCEKLCMVRI